MTGTQDCSTPADCLGQNSIWHCTVANVFICAIMALLIMVGPGLAQGRLQGSYSNDGLFITFEKDRASVFYGGRLCIGDFEGQVEKRSDGFFVVGRDCEIALTLQADGGLNLQQGPGCSAWHGARCSLSGSVYPDM